MESMESSSGGGGTGTMSVIPEQFRNRKKCVGYTTAIFGIVILLVIVASVHHDGEDGVSLRNLPAAFSSASSGSGSNGNSVVDSRRVSLADTSRGRFYPSHWNGSWISDVEFLYRDNSGGLNIWNVQASNKTQIMSGHKFGHFRPLDYSLSADKRYLLIKRTSHRVFRRSSFGTYDVMNLENGVMDHLQPSNLSKSKQDQDEFLIRYVSWAPQGNGLVYVDFDNNIYYRNSVLSQDEQLSDTGEAWVIYNGIPDWVFEEEVFEDNRALWWSPDATKLVWGSFNDSEVKTYLLEKYGPWTQNIWQYPEILEVRYPKVGEVNPINSLWLTDLKNGAMEKKQILPPQSLQGSEVHFAQVTWADQGTKFAVTWFNRIQNESVITLCDVNALDCSGEEIFRREEPNGWVPYKYKVVFNPLPPNPKTQDFVTILPAPFLKHHYRQLVYVTGDSKVYLTKVDGAEVTDILEWTEDGFIYYMSTLPYQPGTRHLFRMKIHSTQKSSECVSCNRTMEDIHREPCQYYKIDMSQKGSFMTMVCQGPDIPYACIHHTDSSKKLLTFETNSRLETDLKKLDMPILRYLSVPVSESDQKAQVKLLLPPDFDSGKKYPLVVYSYGGPGYQSVNMKFDWNEIGTYLAGSANVVYAIVDPRGSGYQGEDWRFAVYKRFGTAEVQSLTQVAKHLQDNLGYIDKSKTAVWGWSYGGYLSLMSLAKDKSNVFQCGASVAPVADWSLYDTYYTERYMGLNTKEDNQVGYNRSSSLHYLKNLKHKKYYLLHGTHDDNVHYQNSMLLSAALESHDILFRQQAYPDQDHSISQYRIHLDHSLVNFFLDDCFDLL